MKESVSCFLFKLSFISFKSFLLWLAVVVFFHSCFSIVYHFYCFWMGFCIDVCKKMFWFVFATKIAQTICFLWSGGVDEHAAWLNGLPECHNTSIMHSLCTYRLGFKRPFEAISEDSIMWSRCITVFFCSSKLVNIDTNQ